MKNVLLLFTIMYCLSAEAQIEKGTKMIGIGLGNMSYDFEAETFSISLYPSAARFVNPQLAIGAQANLGVQFVDEPAFVIGLRPFARLYSRSQSADRFFGQATIGGNTLIQGDPLFYFSYGAGAGYNRFINPNLALELGLFYNGIAGDFESNIISLNLGVQVFLRKEERLFRRKELKE